jgi:hypothetical protein
VLVDLFGDPRSLRGLSFRQGSDSRRRRRRRIEVQRGPQDPLRGRTEIERKLSCCRTPFCISLSFSSADTRFACHSFLPSCCLQLTSSHGCTIMEDGRLREVPLYFLWLLVSLFPVTADGAINRGVWFVMIGVFAWSLLWAKTSRILRMFVSSWLTPLVRSFFKKLSLYRPAVAI